ncbi:MAG: hypothetical protein ACD_20C00173G0001 [uncultured bacterium]|nr:MAG: hypothetical protein ACD_20C00173G0001 [uncultured bacterium]
MLKISNNNLNVNYYKDNDYKNYQNVDQKEIKPDQEIKLSKVPVMGLVSFTGHNTLQQIQALRNEVAKKCEINTKSSLLSWESETQDVSDERQDEIAKQQTELALKLKERATSPRIGILLDQLKDTKRLNKIDKAIIRDTQKSFDEETKIPSEFTAEWADLTSRSPDIWAKARKNDKYEDFEDTLSTIFNKSREKAGYLSKTDSPYNVLLDNYEPGMNTDMLDKLFGELRKDLVPLVKQIQEKVDANPKINEFEFLNRPVDIKKMEEFSQEVAKDMGFDFSRGQIGKSAHPFTIWIDSPKDVRFTLSDLSKKPDFKQATVADCIEMISTLMHEAGHGLVEQGADESLHKTGLTGATMGIHESQSRLWENMVGRSKPFWKHYYPKLQEKIPELKDIDLDKFYCAVNRVQPSIIRTAADEATYNLHIMLRYDLEKDLMKPNGNIKEKVKDLPQQWNKKMNEYLGITPKNNAEGVLQDIHWSCGDIGYFPSYTIGNLASAQIYNKAKEEIPDLEKRIENGDLKTLHNWLKEKMYKNGTVDTPDEILKNVTGESLNPKYFADYLKNKYSEIYDLK